MNTGKEINTQSSRFAESLPNTEMVIKGQFKYENNTIDVEFLSTNAPFNTMLNATIALRDELNRLIEQKDKCPFYKK